MTRSDSPYTRHGALLEASRDERRVTLVGDPTPFQLAHRELGEWREWRALLDANGVISPFALRGADHTQSKRLVKDFPLDDGSGFEPEDLTEDLGIPFDSSFPDRLIYGEGALLIEDIAEGKYTIAFRAPGAEVGTSSDPVALLDAQWADGALPFVELEHEDIAIAFDLSRDLFLILWLAREFPVRFAPEPVRDTLMVPGVNLG